MRRWRATIVFAALTAAMHGFGKVAVAQECVAAKPANFEDLPTFRDSERGNGCYQDPSGQECGRLDFCFGVMVSHESSFHSSCCDLYPSCGETKTLIDSLHKLRRLSLSDLVISAIICALSMYYLKERDGDDLKKTLSSILILVLEIVDLGISSRIIVLVRRENSAGNSLRDTVDALIGAECFSDPHDPRKIGAIYEELETFETVQIVELAFECVLVILHAGKICLCTSERADGGALLLDFMEVVLAAVAFGFLDGGFDDFYDVYDSMTRQAASNACIYTWCFVSALKAGAADAAPPPPPPPAATSSPTTGESRPTPFADPSSGPTAPTSPQGGASAPPPVSAGAATSTREAAIRAKISAISGEATLRLPGSPQVRALDWLSHDDPLELGPEDPSLEQRHGLALMYYSLGGATWESSKNWLGGRSECEWEHVACDRNGRITEIMLRNNRCEGVIPEEISILEKLEKLSLAQNKVHGVLPEGMFQLGNIKFLELADTEVTGSISGEIGNLSNLKHLDMFNTGLTGTLPLDELSGLSELEALHLGTDSIRSWTNYFTRLDSNYERRSLPSAIRNLRKLNSLRINAGALTGTIPHEIGELTLLNTLQLYSNFLSGPIPSTIGNLTGLQSLRLNLNSLTGTVPSSLSLLSSLNTFRLESNEGLTGTLPAEICTETAVPSLWGVWVTCNVQCCVDCCSLCIGGRRDNTPCD